MPCLAEGGPSTSQGLNRGALPASGKVRRTRRGSIRRGDGSPLLALHEAGAFPPMLGPN